MREIKNAVILFLSIVVLLAFFAIAANAQTTNEAVCILQEDGRQVGSGTMIATTDDGQSSLVISCYHVCWDHLTPDAVFANVPAIKDQKFPGRVVKLSSQWDIAALLIPNPGFPPAAIGDFKPHPGIYSACGYGWTKQGSNYCAARGELFSTSGNCMWTRVGIWPGHSGGGLFDSLGRWSGVTNWNDGTNGPRLSGFTRSRSGEPLQQFVSEALNECGPFKKLFNRGGGGGGGGGDCPGGVCPDPNLSGPGYGLAPGYQPLTPLASQPQAVTPPAVVAPPAAQVTVALPTTQPAPVPEEPKPEPAIDNPYAELARQLEAAYRNEREQAAAAAAMTAYRAAMNGEASTPVVQRLPKQADVESKEPATLVTNLPVVTMQVEYREPDGRVRVESAKLDLANFVRQQFGLGGEEE